MKRIISVCLYLGVLLTVGLAAEIAVAQTHGESALVTATCTGTPCPMGAVLTAEAIEWQRGTDKWRETLMAPGDTHVIDLKFPEDNALIEGYPGFVVSVRGCNPQPF